MAITIGILKHEKLGKAENILKKIIENRGNRAVMINPLKEVYHVHKNKTTDPDVIIARCELNDLTDKAFTAYLLYFNYCDKNNIPIINSKEFLLSGQNKFATHLAVTNYLKKINLNDKINPETVIVFNIDQAVRKSGYFINKFGSVVIKKPDSGRGKGVYNAKSMEEVKKIIFKNFDINEPILLQETIAKEMNEKGGFRDIRLWVYRDALTNKPKVAGGYYRNSLPNQFLTNISQKGYITELDYINNDLEFYAKVVLEATQGDVAGIDFVKDINGKIWFEEVNVSFETGKESIKLLGNIIWEKTVELAESKIKKG